VLDSNTGKSLEFETGQLNASRPVLYLKDLSGTLILLKIVNR